MADLIGTHELAAVVQQMANSRRSGTLFIRTHDSHASMLVFDEGRLVAINHGGHRGANAIPLLLEFSEGTYSVSDTVLGQPQNGLPDVDELVNLLTGHEQFEPPVSPVRQRPSAPATAPAAPPPSSFPAARAFERIGEAMIDFVGPIGPALCKRKAASLGHLASFETAWAAVGELAADIGNRSERERFLDLAKTILREHSRP